MTLLLQPLRVLELLVCTTMPGLTNVFKGSCGELLENSLLRRQNQWGSYCTNPGKKWWWSRSRWEQWSWQEVLVSKNDQGKRWQNVMTNWVHELGERSRNQGWLHDFWSKKMMEFSEKQKPTTEINQSWVWAELRFWLGMIKNDMRATCPTGMASRQLDLTHSKG